jgi:transposase
VALNSDSLRIPVASAWFPTLLDSERRQECRQLFPSPAWTTRQLSFDVRQSVRMMLMQHAECSPWRWCWKAGRAGEILSMDLQIVCDWVHRYNAEGLQGLRNRTTRRKPRLSPGQERELAELVRKGPNLAEHGVVRWRRIDVSHVIEQRYGVKLAERSVDDLLRRLAFPTNIDAATLSQIGHRDPGGA